MHIEFIQSVFKEKNMNSLKKSVLFVCYGLGIGGIEKCLVNLINAMPSEEFDIDILLMNPEYDLKNQIKRNVCFLDSFKYVMNTTDTYPEIKRRGGIIKNLNIFIRYLFFRILNRYHKKSWILFRNLKREYDYAVAYSQNDFSPYFVIDKVSAKKKFLWYHNGTYEKNDAGFNIDKVYYNRFDKIVAVSNDCRFMLQNKFHFDDNRVTVIHNIVNQNSILELSNENNPFGNELFTIVTVGRLTKEKGADLAVFVCKKLIDDGFKIKWHWVGDGNQFYTIRELIEKNNLFDYFILEGNKINPYPYIKNADLYVQPSYYEAYSTTITEAKVLCKPIVTTDVGGMREQLTNGVNGFIVDISVNAIYKAILQIIKNNKIAQEFCFNLSNFDITNQFEPYRLLFLS